MAGLGRKVFNSGDILLASEVQGFLQDQSVMVFDDDDARTAAIATPTEGMVTFRKDDNALEVFAGSTFVAVGSEPGLVHIESQTFSAVAAVNFSNGVFSSAFDNYKILFKGVGSTTVECRFRLRVAGVDNSTASSYNIQRLTVNNATFVGTRTADNRGWFGVIFSTAPNSFSAEIFNPFLAVPTAFMSHNFRNLSGASLEQYYQSHNQSTSFDSINIIASTGNFTGEMSLYGYAKA